MNVGFKFIYDIRIQNTDFYPASTYSFGNLEFTLYCSVENSYKDYFRITFSLCLIYKKIFMYVGIEFLTCNILKRIKTVPKVTIYLFGTLIIFQNPVNQGF